MKYCKLVVLVLLLNACGSADKDFPLTYDLTPPKLVSFRVTGSRDVVFEFDEAIRDDNTDFYSEQDLVLENSMISGNRLEMAFEKPMIPGEKYTCRIMVMDEKSNSSSLIIPFFGFNPEKPVLLINEFNPRGSDTSPDCLELFVREGGLMGGLTVTLGSLLENDGVYVFPNFRVETGDYIILHCKPEGNTAEIDETVNKNASGGLLAHSMAWDLWWDDAPGLSGNNGVIALWENPMGGAMDMIVYTDRVTDPANEFTGWTSAVFKILQSFKGSFDWICLGEIPTPNDSIAAGTSTATRSVCRNSRSEDTDSNNDWHIVPTSKKSFGFVNTDEVY
jgi:hypothetical protein